MLFAHAIHAAAALAVLPFASTNPIEKSDLGSRAPLFDVDGEEKDIIGEARWYFQAGKDKCGERHGAGYAVDKYIINESIQRQKGEKGGDADLSGKETGLIVGLNGMSAGLCFEVSRKWESFLFYDERKGTCVLSLYSDKECTGGKELLTLQNQVDDNKQCRRLKQKSTKKFRPDTKFKSFKVDGCHSQFF